MVEQGKITNPHIQKPANYPPSMPCSARPDTGGLFSLIPLTQRQFAIVDNEDFDWLNQWKWCLNKGRHTCYAARGVRLSNGKTQIIKMHRQILGLVKSDGIITDHKDHNGLNNQKANLRKCTRPQNQHNRIISKHTSKYKGVYWNKPAKKWHGVIMYNRQRIHLGYFNSEIEAAKAYDTKARKLYSEFANTNF